MRSKEIISSPIINQAVNAEGISLAGDFHELVEGFDIAGLLHDYPFAGCQPDVVACLLFHLPQDLILSSGQIDHKCARWLDLMRAEDKLWRWRATRKRIRSAIPEIRFHFKKYSSMSFANRIYLRPKLLPIHPDRAFGNVRQAKTQRQLSEKYLSATISRQDMRRFPAKAAFQFSPSCGLQDMRVREAGKKIGPGLSSNG